MAMNTVLLALVLTALSRAATADATCPIPAPPPADAGQPSVLTVAEPYTVPIGSICSFDYVNVLNGGSITFQDGSGTTTFNARSILIEQGGSIQAGTPEAPFGTNGGHLDIGLWGSAADTIPPIACQGTGGCYPATAVGMACYNYKSGNGFDPTNPCQTPLTTQGANQNMYFEGYGPSNTPTNPSNSFGQFGRKVLAVSYGGSLKLFGKKGVQTASSAGQASCEVPSPPKNQGNIQNWANLSQVSWARLNANATAGGSSLVLDRPVDWNEGDQLIVGTTDWHAGHSELVTVQSASGSANTTLTLNGSLTNNHNGTAFQVPAGLTSPTKNPNTTVENRAVVGLLSRSITIQSLGPTVADPFPAVSTCGLSQQATTANPDCYYGGHLLIRQGFAVLQLQGVEFHHLGQGGTIGSYPVHFHLAKDTQYTNAFVRDSSIWESNTRFITLHGTHDVELSRNVGYLSMGHGYYLEDGSEINNLLCDNLGVSGRAAFLEYFNAQDSDSPEARFIPPILNGVNDPTGSATQQLQGSDAAYPTMFWMMNAWNEFVGNQAVGLGGFGVCYWPLSSSVSGPSTSLHWAANTSSDLDYANFNQAGQYQAPLKRCRGNGCSTAAYALMTERKSVTPDGTYITAAAPTATPSSSMVASNPASPAPNPPTVQSNFMPIQYGTTGAVCAAQQQSGTATNNNASCVATVIDRFTTSFNWAQANFGSIWLRPWSWVLVNSAVTDQLFGGLGFVSGGSWDQVLDRQLAIIKDSIFVGSVNPDDPDAGESGPDMASLTPTSNYCVTGQYCLFPSDGTALPVGGLNPKRMLTIYDGPFFSEGNVFAQINTETNAPDQSGGANGCNPPSNVATKLLSIYDTTQQIALQKDGCQPVANVTQYEVPSASVGWKQPNGFYYPPAFAFKGTSFDSDTSAYKASRHNVLDQNKTYTTGLQTFPSWMAPATLTQLSATPIDVTTILNDLDGTLNGLVPTDTTTTQSSGLSNNAFYDAPYTVDECNSVGTQTLPNPFVTSVVTQLDQANPTMTLGTWGSFNQPAVAVYRQLLTGSAGESCSAPNTQACIPGATNCCRRGTFFMGAYIGQAPGLTMNDGIYYVDTNSQNQPNYSSMVPPPPIYPATFQGGKTYGVYNLYANSKTSVTYQVYVGSGFNATTDFEWILVDPHTLKGGQGQFLVTENTTPPPPPSAGRNQKNPRYDATTGLLTVTLSHVNSQGNYTNTINNGTASDICYPANLCEANKQSNQCTLNPAFTELGLTGTIGDICGYWATRTTQEMTDTVATTGSAGTVYLNDCPAGGCLGFAFTLPTGFTPVPYSNQGTTPFLQAQWPTSLQNTPGSTATCPTPDPSGNFPKPPKAGRK
jgi:hypothetical protein